MAVPANFEIQGPLFAPMHIEEYYKILTERYNAARLEAGALAGSGRVSMRVEFFKPTHFNWAAGVYRLPTGVTTKTLKPNTAFFPAGVINNDPCFDYMKWWEGAGTRYIGDWFTLPVYYFTERQGAYKGNLKRFEFRANETFRFQVNCTTTPLPDTVNAWMLAFCVMPQTEAEVQITTT